MTKAAALHQFFNGFSIPFYVSTSVPQDATFPYGTYELITSAWEGGEVGITVNLWYRTESEAIPNAKAQELSDAIGLGGKVIQCDNGAIWIKRGSPWCQNVYDDTDPIIKRRYINISLEYFTQN